ncbi:MAG: hypothetical protein ACFBSC_00130 [Microcoleaceae cyanobacterium]
MQPRLPGATFTVVGTYGYTPIEQFGGDTVPASDLYALGTTLIHLLTGIPPAELPQKDFQIQFEEKAPYQLEPQFVRWLEKLIKPSVDNRFQSAQQALIALNAGSSLIHSPTHTGIRLTKSKESLVIELPSRLSVEYSQPLQRNVLQLAVDLKRRFQNVPRLVKLQIASVLALSALSLWALPLPLNRIGISTAQTLLYLPLMLLMLGVPIGITGLILLLNSGLNYFEKVRLLLDEETVEICWKSTGLPRQRKVKLKKIQQVNLVQTKDSRGRIHPALEIAIHKPRMFLFSQRNTIQFGQQLQPEELQWLRQEISDWITAKVSV